MSWFIFKGVSSEDMGVIVNRIPLYSPPAERIAFIPIDGRDGDLTKSSDAFDSYEDFAELTIIDPDMRSAVYAWLRGSGDLETDHVPGYAVRARVVNRIDPEKIIPTINKIKVNFHIQPFLYESDPEVVIATASRTLNNPGTRKALPLITVYGAGTLTIAGQVITVAANAYGSISINSEIQECANNGTPVNDLVSFASKEFPVIDPGAYELVIGAGITQVDIKGNWRWF